MAGQPGPHAGGYQQQYAQQRPNFPLAKEARYHLSQNIKASVKPFAGTFERRPGFLSHHHEALLWIDSLISFFMQFLRSFPPDQSGLSDYNILNLILPMLLVVKFISTEDDGRRRGPQEAPPPQCPSRQWYESLAETNDPCLFRMLPDPNQPNTPNFYHAFYMRYLADHNLYVYLEPQLRNMDITQFNRNFSQYKTEFRDKLRLLARLNHHFDETAIFGFMHGHWRNVPNELSALYRAYRFRNTTEFFEALESEQRGASYVDAYGRRQGEARPAGIRRGTKPPFQYMALEQAVHESYESHESYADPMSDDDDDVDQLMVCHNCGVEEETPQNICLCAYVDPDHHLDSHEFVDHLDDALSVNAPAVFNALQAAKMPLTGQEAQNLVINSKCHVCGELGHFTRDCPKNNGSGHSVLGARYGTADGFKEGDDISLRPVKYREAQQKRLRKHRAITAKSQKAKSPEPRGSSSSRPVTRGRTNPGKFATHARRMRTGKATAPKPTRYQALLNAIVLYAISETQCAGCAQEPDSTMASMATEIPLPDPDILQDPASDSDQE